MARDSRPGRFSPVAYRLTAFRRSAVVPVALFRAVHGEDMRWMEGLLWKPGRAGGLYSTSSAATGVRMKEDSTGRLDGEGAAALSLMQEALTLLDQCKGTSEVGAHLDLAICRLRDLIGREASRGPFRS